MFILTKDSYDAIRINHPKLNHVYIIVWNGDRVIGLIYVELNALDSADNIKPQLSYASKRKVSDGYIRCVRSKVVRVSCYLEVIDYLTKGNVIHPRSRNVLISH